MKVIEYHPKVECPELCIWSEGLYSPIDNELEIFCTHPCDDGRFCQLASEGHCYLYQEY